jgi:hypothetical protein
MSRSNSGWSTSELDHLFRLQKIKLLETGLSKSELDSKDRRVYVRFQSWIAPNTKIACVTLSPMQGETVCTDDDIINAAGVE